MDVELCQRLLQTHAVTAHTTPRLATLGFPGFVGPVGVTRARPLAQSEHPCQIDLHLLRGLLRPLNCANVDVKHKPARAHTTPRPASEGYPLVTGIVGPVGVGVVRSRPLAQSVNPCLK